MPKKYDMSKKSDMDRFMKDIQAVAIDQAKDAALKQKYDVTCPHCQKKVSVLPGKHPCPACRKEINLTLDFHT